MMLKQTKIVASISDERCEVEFIRDLFKAGMNVVRMNTAHASREGFEKLIRNVREVSNRIAILMDTKGPEVRTTAITGGEPIPYKIGDRVKLSVILIRRQPVNVLPYLTPALCMTSRWMAIY